MSGTIGAGFARQRINGYQGRLWRPFLFFAVKIKINLIYFSFFQFPSCYFTDKLLLYGVYFRSLLQNGSKVIRCVITPFRRTYVIR